MIRHGVLQAVAPPVVTGAVVFAALQGTAAVGGGSWAALTAWLCTSVVAIFVLLILHQRKGTEVKQLSVHEDDLMENGHHSASSQPRSPFSCPPDPPEERYRVALPDPCVPVVSNPLSFCDGVIDEEDSQELFAPVSVAAPVGVVTFVFTDIECSSVLWRKHPDEMKIAMRLHNNVIRRAYSQYGGYEVKTIGDAFMLTFSNSADALRFCIDAQVDLLKQPWPHAILDDPVCTAIYKDDQLVFRGMRVRMGVHTGSVTVEVDPVSNRSDYYGHTVNTAARVESAGSGGSIVASEAVLKCLGTTTVHASVVHLGQITLRGVGKVELSGIVPTEISLRGATLAPSRHTRSQQGSASPGSRSGSNIISQLTPGSGARPRFLRSLLRDLYNDRVLSDPIIKAAVEGFMASDELRSFSASVSQIRLGPNLDRLPPALGIICTLARKTFGIVLNTVGTTVTIVWICQQHAIQAVSFAGSLYEEFDGTKMKMHMGLATGGVMLGITHPGDDRHYVTCIGSPVELSGALAEAAEQVDVCCLVPGSIVANVASIAWLLRPIDRWPISGMRWQAFIEVSELFVEGLEGVEKWDLMYGMQGEGMPWFDPEFKEAYEAAKIGNLDLMERVVKRDPGDSIAARIVRTKGKQLTRTEFISGQTVKTSDTSKEDLEEAWKRTTAASRSATAELVYMEGWAHDVATFIHSHPGGRGCFRPFFGKDITDVFHGEGSHGHSAYASEILRTLRVFKTNGLSTNESNMMIVRDSWKELRSAGLNDIGVLLFKNVFERNPEFKLLFPWGRQGNVYEKGLQDHGMQVMTAVDKAVTDLSKANEVAHTLHELGKTHIRFGIQRQMFDIMGEAFDDTFMQALQEKYTPQVKYAWMQCIGKIIQHAKDGVATDDAANSTDALVVGEYRKIVFVKKEQRAKSTYAFTFKADNISKQHVPPGSHVSIRFNSRLSRPYSILHHKGDEITFMIKLNNDRTSSALLSSLTVASNVEGRGLLLSEYQYRKGIHQELYLCGAGTGCTPLISIARAALRDGCRVVLFVCFNTFSHVPYHEEFEELSDIGGDRFVLKYLFTRSAEFPSSIKPFMANSVVAAHMEEAFESPSEFNHVVICGPPTYNTMVRAVTFDMGYTLSVMGMLA